MCNSLVIHLAENDWVMVMPSDTVELSEAVLCKLYASVLGKYVGYKKLEASVWFKAY